MAASSLCAQDLKKIDSLKQKLVNAQKDDRFIIFNELFKQYNSTDYKTALNYANGFYNLAVSNADSVRIVQGGRMRAYSLMDLSRNEEAIETLGKILGIARRNQKSSPELKKQIKFILNNAGLANMYIGNFDKALNLHYQSLLLREEEGDMKSIRTARNNIGLVFYNIKDNERAIQNYLKAVEISEGLKDFTGMERIYINLGLSYNSLGEFNSAIKFFDKGFEICNKNCDDNVLKEGLVGLGYAYLLNKKTKLAKEKFSKSLEIATRQKDKRYICENLYFLGRIEIQQKNDKIGIEYLDRANLLADSINLVATKINIYDQYATYYAGKKDYEKSFFYKNKYSQFKDSIFHEQLTKNITKVQTNYDQRENLKTIAEKNLLVALQKEVIVRQQRQNVFIITITGLIVSLAVVLYVFIRQQQKANYKISQAKLKIEEQNKLLEARVAERTKHLIFINEALKQVNDELDEFIYKTSHDIRGPLATIKGMCNIALMDVKDEVAISYLRKMDATADRMNTILVRLMIVNNINGSVLAPVRINFKEIIDEIFVYESKKIVPDRFSLTHDIETGCSIVSDIGLVRIILENLIDNAIKFYNNSGRLDPFAKVTVCMEKGNVKITVEDNGIGMESMKGKEVFKMFMRASERSEIGGLGLYLTKLASEKIGGKVRLVHSDAKGSLFEVKIPLDLNEVIKSRIKSEQDLVELIEKQAEPNSKPSSTVI